MESEVECRQVEIEGGDERKGQHQHQMHRSYAMGLRRRQDGVACSAPSYFRTELTRLLPLTATTSERGQQDRSS